MGEVEKEFDVVEIDPNKEIPVGPEDEAEKKKKEEEKEKKKKEPKFPWEQDEEEEEDNERCDVLVAVQPSMLTEEAMDRFLSAMKAGLPTVIFEDPLPVAPLIYQQFLNRILWPTSEGRRPRTQAPNRQLMMQMFVQSMKADSAKLWETLGIEEDRDLEFDPKRVIWQDYSPTARLERLPEEYVFIDQNCGAEEPLSEDDSITAGLRRLFFVFPGGIPLPEELPQGFSPLVTTGRRGGTITYDWDQYSRMEYLFGDWDRDRKKQAYVLAAYVQSPKKKPKPDDEEEKDQQSKKGDNEKNPSDEAQDESAGGDNEKVHALVVFDIDSLIWFWPLLGNEEFDNLSLVLNALDVMGADVDLLEIRNRRPKHRTLTGIQAVIDEARQEAEEAIDEVEERFREGTEGEEGEEADEGGEAESAAEGLVARREEAVSKQYAEEAKRRELRAIQTELAAEIQQIQSRYKIWAVVVPPIPPLLIALVVFVIRRFREDEGVASTRRR
jgi:ABC-2 type transport system permease protein